MTQRVDAAGTTSFTWTPRFELDTVTDPATGTILDYTWDAASELTGVDYGTSGAVRTYSYDGQGRLKTDTLVDDTSTTVVSDVYGYDSDSNLTSKTIVLPGNGAAGSHSYTYDYADRLASWTDPSSTTVDYTWDLAGNRVGAGSDTFTYDQRNRLTSGPEGDYTYTARGTLDTIDTTRVYGYDPLGRLTSAEGVTYGYDGLDRVATRRSDTFEYSDTGYDPTTDANQTYTRTPGGHLLSITDGTSNLLAGVDRHGDLTHLYQADGTITDTVSYNPFGDPTDTTGSFAPTVGFQSDWTDPTTTHVWQGARWYQPAWAGFLSRDTIRGELSTPVSLNRYTYANNNPLNYWDPYGQQPIDLTYGGQNCEINYACAPTPATTTRPATPPTGTGEAADAILKNLSRRYGLSVIQGQAAHQMQAYLEAHGALPGGWDNATFRTQSNVYAWTLLRNTGRTNLSQAEFRALADDEWTQIWAQQGNAALDDVYKRQCGWVCRNKNWITPVATTTAAVGVSIITGGTAATWAAGAGYTTITTGAIAGGAGGLGGSLTAQTITGNYSLNQTLIDTAIGTITGGVAAKLTTGATAADDLAEAARRASGNVEPGQGPVYGTRVHSEFADEIGALGRSDLHSEVSYLNGRVVPYGTKGSVRLDAVVGTPSAPTAIYDLKTGSATLSPSRIQQILSHLPTGYRDIPVLELRP
jgi:RHS repeat-associated protein